MITFDLAYCILLNGSSVISNVDHKLIQQFDSHLEAKFATAK